QSRNSNSTINYEVDRTIQHTTRAMGAIKRLSVAVVVNHRSKTDNNGRTTTTPPTDAEVERINNLVREAVGFSADRGDSLNVATSEFAPDLIEETPELPLWKDPEIIDIGKQALRYLLVLGVLAYAAFGVIKPLMKSITPPPRDDEDEATQAGAGGSDEEEVDEDGVRTTLSSSKPPSSYEAKLARAREQARDDPKMVANLIKEWMGVGEEARK
ncbi:MAG: flagellar basal body M-ring protein FliF, partial [Rhodocyclaceae bacterium]|nr:flagellar basal body M-ring protein FliF [Rhodocyclaceae bacterium]